MMRRLPKWFPCLVDGEGDLRLPFGLLLKGRAWRMLLLELSLDLPDRFKGKYIEPVHTKRDTALLPNCWDSSPYYTQDVAVGKSRRGEYTI
jgi:hypothetical protein